MPNTTFIYALVDPRDNRVRYIGKSNNPDKRLEEHIERKGKNLWLNRWLAQLANINLKPCIRIIMEAPKSEWRQWEKHWIAAFRWAGERITNIQDGGQGFTAGYIPSEETREKMKASHWSRQGLKPANYLSNNKLIQRIQNKAKELGHAPLASEMGSQATTIYRRFGTWDSAITLAGLSIYTIPKGKRKFGISKGEMNGRSKLTFKDVQLIRTKYATENITIKKLAQEYPVCSQMISRIVRYEAWK